MTSTSRSLQNAWDTAWATAPPAACQTLRNLNNNVAWGQTCVFAAEDNDPLPFSINTACMPWVTSNIYPSTSAFYSPATGCPTSWVPVATATSGGAAEQWIDGETAIHCCPDGFVGDGGSGCRPGSTGSWPVVECGEADADENELRTYSAAAWPATATPGITALQIRFQASDIGSATATGSLLPSESGGAGAGNTSASGNGNGLSTGAIIAIAVVIPLVLLIGAVAAFLLWRRRRHRKAVAAYHLTDKDMPENATGRSPGNLEIAQSYNSSPSSKLEKTAHMGTAGLTGVAAQHETPEWNAELDSSEVRKQQLGSSTLALASANSTRNEDVSELGGLARVPRKPIAPVEMEGTPVAEMGDAYIPYRPERAER